jgi:phosphatidate cytidylyltransferase
MVATLGVLLAYERANIASAQRVPPEFLMEAVGIVLAGYFVYGGDFLLAAVSLALGASAGALISWRFGRWPIWSLAGVSYIGLAVGAVIWLRGLSPNGLELTIWLFGVVWATDIAALVVGQSFRGPKLAPRLSPNKTWSGLLGGLSAAAAVSAIFAAEGVTPAGAILASDIGCALLLGALVGLTAQGGDLLESAYKRHFNVKDSGSIIPGHGGVMDRLDGLAASALLVAIIVLQSHSN